MREARASINASVTLATAAVEHAGHADRAIQVTENSAKRQLRAYLFSVSGSIRWGGRDASSVTIIVRNYGLTPAYAVEIYTIFDTVEVEKGLIFPGFETCTTTKIGVIAPRGQLKYTQEAEKTLSLLYREGEGPKMILVWGEIRYKDTFGDAQWSRYCLRTIGPNENEMEPSEVGNEAS